MRNAKQTISFILFALVLTVPAFAESTYRPLNDLLSGVRWSEIRSWTGRDNDNGAVHCLGNGRLCVYEQGPDILQVFGPPYSAITIGRIDLEGDGLSCTSQRAWGTAVWRHVVNRAGIPVAEITDFVCDALPALVRVIHATSPLAFVYKPGPELRVAGLRSPEMERSGVGGSLLVETPIGMPLVPFGRYPMPCAVFNQVAWKGAANAEQTDAGLHLSCGPGETILYVTGGPELEACLQHMEAVLTATPGALLRETLSSWERFTASGRDFEAELPPNTPERLRLLQVLDDTAVMIKTQQAAEGGILAGYPYHLGYVRDQYGTHRGLVALGHEEMSRDILRFYWETFQRGGQIRNAQAFGFPGVYHVHENDDVEITGYITVQAFDYLHRSGDKAFIREILPMLTWAWEAQQHHLVKGMLPFNGDETYVAGGILPRSALNDGSAEATLLFVEGSELLLDFVEEAGLWDAAHVSGARETVAAVRDVFRTNFMRDGRLITNNPDRASAAAMPRARHGVCEHCMSVEWTLRTGNGRYVCISCMNKGPLPAAGPEVFMLQSVSLTPLYFHASLLAAEELRPEVEAIVAGYKNTGKLPSRPDGNVAVGYDYGLLLYALTELNHPMARDLFEKTLSLADDTGAWAEYYRDHQPASTRCRPWESALNVEALLHWIEAEYKMPGHE